MKYLFPFTLLLVFACKNQPADNTGSLPINADEELPEGFSDFYQRFHLDSAYQMEHIIFPLEGIPDNADLETIQSATFRWQKENWQLMRPVDYQMSEYRRDFIPLTREMVLERIIHKSGEFGMVRRFAIISGDWHLIYYAGVNRLAK